MPTFDLELPATIEHLGEARRRLQWWLAEEVLDDVARADLLVVAGEFFLHVVFRTGGLGRARIVADRADEGVRLAVTCAAEGRERRPLWPRRDPLEAGALGRRLVEGCCTDVRVDRGGAACFRPVGRSS